MWDRVVSFPEIHKGYPRWPSFVESSEDRFVEGTSEVNQEFINRSSTVVKGARVVVGFASGAVAGSARINLNHSAGKRSGPTALLVFSRRTGPTMCARVKSSSRSGIGSQK
ncbi:hypothetical protein R1sor_000802 [Riccia sorocarpa]|uniref:Uncharacterized protein n=1 Tax=Riccia sorocarpa TaxID=122646 RepID=A0ABD3GXE1_9MARC